jgi:hypothetical protein
MDFPSILAKIDFVKRYTGSNKKLYLEILKKLDNSFLYLSQDRMFKIDFKYNSISLDLGLVVKDGLIEPFLFYIVDGEAQVYNRFDGLAEELQTGFRDRYTIPMYKDEIELEEILRLIFSIYQDIKNELVNEAAA